MEKINYQKKTDEIVAHLENEGTRPSLLLQSCCGPCSSYVLEYLSRYFAVTVLYYNPNIYPKAEYDKRLGEQRRLIKEMRFSSTVGFMDCQYDGERYFGAVRGLEDLPEGGGRCAVCFRLRLEETAKRAKDGGFDYFGTTLTVSPHKNADLINRLGIEIGEKYKVSFLPSDFKKRNGYKRSIELSKMLDLYRQDYCGCKFSLNKKEK